MPFRSPRPFSSISARNVGGLVAVLAALLPAPASATVTVTPVNAGGTSGKFAYYASNKPFDGISGNAFIDTGVTAFDLTAYRGTDAPRTHMLVFDVISDKAFAAAADSEIVLTVRVSVPSGGSSTAQFIPLVAAGPGGSGTPTDCDASKCQGNKLNDWLFAAKYTEKSLIRVGFFPAEACFSAFNLSGALASGCASSSGPAPSNGVPVEMTFNFVFSVVKKGGMPELSDTTETAAMTAHFQGNASGFNCSSGLSNLYFPGDGSIKMDPVTFLLSRRAPTDAPEKELVLVANDGKLPDVTSGFASGTNAVVARLPYNGPQDVKGFVNTTDGTDHKYQVSFLIRDLAGIVSTPKTAGLGSCDNTATSCCLNGVQTSGVEGFLKKSSCFIATAAYRSGDAAPVRMLREFRDVVLLRFDFGKAFVRWYYGWSPAAAEWLLANPGYRYPVLILLLPVEAVAAVALLAAKFLGVLGGIFLASDVMAAQPYIDKLKAGLDQKESYSAVEPGSQPYIDKIKRTMTPVPVENGGGGYIDRLKKTDPEGFSKQEETGGTYLEREKAKLEDKEKGGAIAALKEGRSQLKADRSGEIHHAASFKLGAKATRDITASGEAGARTFSEVYGTGWAPDLMFGYEWQPFHSEWFGSVGLAGSLGFSMHTGTGKFRVALKNPVTTEEFGTESKTKLQFFSIPAFVGLNYRFNLLRIVRPYVQAGPALLGYAETRNDDQGGNRGFSRGLIVTGGAAILLDWISGRSTWDLYAEHGVKHYYLTLDYTRAKSIQGDVAFDVSGINAGLTFEF